MTPEPSPGSPPRPSSKWAAELIGMSDATRMLKTSRATFYRWLRSGKIKGWKVGRQWRFHPGDLERFMRGEGPRVDLPAAIEPLLDELGRRLEEHGADHEGGSEDGDAEQAVIRMIRLAVAMGASDIHLAPHLVEDGREGCAVLRFRLDGVLRPIVEINLRLLPALVQQWKTLAACDLHEVARPQEGRIRMQLGADGRPTEILVSTLPATMGESVTARLLDTDTGRKLSLERIGFTPRIRKKIDRALEAPSGLTVVTGPTGCGKTTTLYACLKQVARPGLKLISIEDPVEYLLPWLVQVPVRSQEGLTFPQIIRASLRSDPDVVMIAEIRDRESWVLAQQVALTGHLVLTALHAPDAARALLRLVEVTGDGYIVGEAARLAVAQQLVRKLCRACSVPGDPLASDLERAEQMTREGGLDWDELPDDFRTPVGCPECARTGYRGRTVIAEALEVTPEISALLRDGAAPDAIRARAVSQGLVTLAAEGIRRATLGETTVSEVTRVLGLRESGTSPDGGT